MDNSYTPGPWKWVNTLHEAYSIVTEYDSEKVAGINFAQNKKRDRRQDAQLIACAPELLEMLQRFLNNVQNNYVPATDIIKAHKLIKRATKQN